MLQLLQQHYVVAVSAFAYIGIAATSAMAPPGTPAGGWYGWFYRFSNSLVPLAEQHFHLPPPEPPANTSGAGKTQS